MVSDIHVDQKLSLLKTLTRKLYKMNPGELAKTPGATMRIFGKLIALSDTMVLIMAEQGTGLSNRRFIWPA